MVLLALLLPPFAGLAAAAVGVVEAVVGAGLAVDVCASALTDKPAMSIPSPKPRTALHAFTFIP
jgi:hypothetical protein